MAAQAHAAGTLLPRGFFLGLGLIYLAALALDRLAERLRLPAAAAILLLGLALHDLLASWHPISSLQVETVERVSLALLIFYAGLGTDLRRIRGSVAAGLRLGSLGVVVTLVVTGVALLAIATPLADGLPPAAAWLCASCLTAIDSAALDDLLGSLRHAVSGRLSHLLQFEAALSTVVSLLGFGFLVGVFQGHGHEGHLDLHVQVVQMMPAQVLTVGRHLLAGLASGVAVGALAPPLINRVVRSESHLLLVAISLAFVAYGVGQLVGGGGLLAVFCTGVWLSNGQYRFTRFDQHGLHRALHPFNTAAECTVLLLLGLTVVPADLITVLPLALVIALVLPLARLAGVWLALPGRAFSAADRLVIAGCGVRGAVPLGLALTMAEELPHLKGIPAAAASELGAHLLALIFLVVLIDLLLQSGLMRALAERLRPSAGHG